MNMKIPKRKKKRMKENKKNVFKFKGEILTGFRSDSTFNFFPQNFLAKAQFQHKWVTFSG